MFTCSWRSFFWSKPTFPHLVASEQYWTFDVKKFWTFSLMESNQAEPGPHLFMQGVCQSGFCLEGVGAEGERMVLVQVPNPPDQVKARHQPFLQVICAITDILITVRQVHNPNQDCGEVRGTKALWSRWFHAQPVCSRLMSSSRT